MEPREAGFTADFPGDIEHDRWERSDDVLQTSTDTFSSQAEGEVGIYTVRVHRIPPEITTVEGTEPRDMMRMLLRGYGNNLVKLLARPGWFRRARITGDETDVDDDHGTRELVFEYRDKSTRQDLVCYAQYLFRGNTLFETFSVVERSDAARARARAFMDSVQYS